MNFIFQFGEFSDSNEVDWIGTITTIITSFGSAFIGAWIALKVYKNTIRDQKTKEETQKNSLEISKLKYLGFLMTDVFMSLDFLINSAKDLRHKSSSNKLKIPVLKRYPLSSLLIISEKINQEDYYHSSVNQLKNDEVAEMFYIINTIARQDEQLIKNYDDQVVNILSIRKVLPKALDQLKDSIGEFIRKVDAGTLKTQSYKDVSKDLSDILLDLQVKHKLVEANTDLVIQSSLDFLVEPVITLLTPYAHVTELTDIVRKAYEADAVSSNITQAISGLINSIEAQVNQIDIATKRLDLVSTSLREFYLKNKTKRSPNSPNCDHPARVS